MSTSQNRLSGEVKWTRRYDPKGSPESVLIAYYYPSILICDRYSNVAEIEYMQRLHGNLCLRPPAEHETDTQDEFLHT